MFFFEATFNLTETFVCYGFESQLSDAVNVFLTLVMNYWSLSTPTSRVHFSPGGCIRAATRQTDHIRKRGAVTVDVPAPPMGLQ